MMRVLVSYHLIQEVLLNRPGLVENAEKLWNLMCSGQIEGYITQSGLDIIHVLECYPYLIALRLRSRDSKLIRHFF